MPAALALLACLAWLALLACLAWFSWLALLACFALRSWIAWLLWLALLAGLAWLRGGEGRGIWLAAAGGIGLHHTEIGPALKEIE